MKMLRWVIVFSCGRRKIVTMSHAKKKKLEIYGIFDTKKEAVECLKSENVETK